MDLPLVPELELVHAALDAAERGKEAKSAELCATLSWGFLPFAADTFGSLGHAARGFLSKVVYKAIKHNPALDPARVANSIWAALTGAAIYRSVQQLAAAAEVDTTM